jgi:Coenzyme PQQ synthesis protein D (PqqD)
MVSHKPESTFLKTNMNVSSCSQWIASPDLVSCVLAGESVILNMASGQYFALNPVGSQIWQWLQEPCTKEVVCQRLIAEYEVSREQCEAEVTALFAKLSEYGLCIEPQL